jgi:hypothetical protein
MSLYILESLGGNCSHVIKIRYELLKTFLYVPTNLNVRRAASVCLIGVMFYSLDFGLVWILLLLVHIGNKHDWDHLRIEWYASCVVLVQFCIRLWMISYSTAQIATKGVH